MDIKWFEDFLSLANTCSFSRSAEERHITQSTLSRRIQSLEEWIGVPLIDRSTHPISLTPAGEQFQKDSWYIVRDVYRAASEARTRGFSQDAPVRFGAQHAVARHLFLPWLKTIEAEADVGMIRVRSDNLNNCCSDLVNGDIDFLLCYQQPGGQGVGDTRNFAGIRITSEPSKPVSIPDEAGLPRFMLPGTQKSPVPYIGFGPDVPIGWHLQRRLEKKGAEHLHLTASHEASMGEIIRELVLDGRGMAWLSECLIKEDLEQGRLVLAGDEKWFSENEIWIYRSLSSGHARLEKIWDAIKRLSESQPWSFD